MSDASPLLTVVTICKNSEATIEKTFASIASQTVKDFEYIVMDGASTDGTISLIKRYEHIIDHWDSKPDISPYPPTNESISIGKGKFITFLYADDWYAEDAVENITAAIKNHQDADIIGFTLMEHCMNKDNEPLPYRLYTEPKRDFDLNTGLYCHGANRAYRRELLLEMGGFHYKKYDQMADRDLCIRLGLKKAKKHFIDKPLYHFLVHAGSNTTSGGSRHGIIAMSEYVNIAKDHLVEATDQDVINTFKYWHSYSAIRLSYFLCLAGKFFKAFKTSLSAFALYPVAFIRALVYLRTPKEFAPQKLERHG